MPDEAFRGKTVVVGATAPSLQDFVATPASEGHEMAGPEMLANAIWTVENGFPLKSVPGWINVMLIVLFGLLGPVVQLRLRPLVAFAATVLLGLLFVVLAQIAFEEGWIVSVVYPLAALVLSAVGALAVTTLITAYERQQVRDTFARFVPEDVVNDVLDHADENLRLAGVRREGTVLFSDLRGFTSFAESLRPDLVIDVLNHYLSEMSDAIMDHGGTLVSYMGDGIMAVFGAPIEQPDHADRAVAAAEEMLGPRLDRFNEWLRAAGPQRRLPDGRRHQQRQRHVGPGRLRAADRIHGGRRHDQHRGAARGDDQRHAPSGLHRRLDPGRDGRRPAARLRRRVPGPGANQRDQGLDAGTRAVMRPGDIVAP